MITNMVKFKLHSCYHSFDVNRYLAAGFKIVSLSISSFCGGTASKRFDKYSKKGASTTSSSDGNESNKLTSKIGKSDKNTSKTSKLTSTSKCIKGEVEIFVTKTDRVNSPTELSTISKFFEIPDNNSVLGEQEITEKSTVKENNPEISASSETAIIASQLTELEAKVPLADTKKVSNTPLPVPIVFTESLRKNSTDSSSSSQDEDTCSSQSKGEADETSSTDAQESEDCDSVPVVSCSDLPEVSGLSEDVVKVPDHPVGPDASKNSIYKNPEYFCYHKYSYNNAQIELMKFMLPQPSIHEPYYHESK